VLTVVFTLPLLTLGAEVTTKKAGMIDKAPVRSPLYLIQRVVDAGGIINAMDQMDRAELIEHSHRTAGWLVGILAIGLAVGLAIFEQRRWLRWAGLAALLAVASQGVLGMLRVELEKQLDPSAGATVALIHGCTAQLVVALLVSVALWTSSAWQRERPLAAEESHGIRAASLILVGVMYLQIVFGAVMRHKELALGTRVHILLAFAVVAAAAWLSGRVLFSRAVQQSALAVKAVCILWVLLAVQLLLGLETLLSKFNVKWSYTGQTVEPVALGQDLIRSLHFVVGALTFSTAVAIALIAYRNVPRPTPRESWTGERQLEGVL
jgi:cytochrome c oxidase assembly protein subunit 15